MSNEESLSENKCKMLFVGHKKADEDLRESENIEFDGKVMIK